MITTTHWQANLIYNGVGQQVTVRRVQLTPAQVVNEPETFNTIHKVKLRVYHSAEIDMAHFTAAMDVQPVSHGLWRRNE
jgi:hypothetical protein